MSVVLAAHETDNLTLLDLRFVEELQGEIHSGSNTAHWAALSAVSN
jgi:hypothetical protein